MAVHVKGIVLQSQIQYVEKFHGKDEIERVMEAVSPETRAMLSGEILVSSWYPLAQTIEIRVAIDRLFGRGDLKLCEEMGRYTARLALEGALQQSFSPGDDPSFVVRMGPVIWRQYYDSGEVEAKVTGPESGIARVVGFAEPHRAVCLSVQGWMEEAFLIWRTAQALVIETRCKARGEEYCEFVCSHAAPGPCTGTGPIPPS